MRILTTTRPKRQSFINFHQNGSKLQPLLFLARSIGFDLFSCTPWTQSFGGLDCSAVCGPRRFLAATFRWTCWCGQYRARHVSKSFFQFLGSPFSFCSVSSLCFEKSAPFGIKHFFWVISRFLVLTKLAKRSLGGSGDHRVRSVFWFSRLRKSGETHLNGLLWVAWFSLYFEVPVLETSKGCIFASGAIARLGFSDLKRHLRIFDWFRPSFCLGTSLESVDPSAFMVRTFWRPWNLKQLDFEFFVWTSMDFYTFTCYFDLFW